MFTKRNMISLVLAVLVRGVVVTNVLIAIDGPAYGKILSDFVVNHHWSPNTHLRLINMIEPVADDVYLEAEFERKAMKGANALLMETATQIRQALPELEISQIVRHGDPREEILREAADWPAQLVVVGSHGRRNVNSSSLGSVSISVLTQAQCTVIVVKIPQKKIEAFLAQASRNTSAHSDSD